MSTTLAANINTKKDWDTFYTTFKYGIKNKGDDFMANLMSELQEKRRQVTAEFRADAEANGTKVELTEAQKRELAEKYDPENMTQEEYEAFVDDLCRCGILKDTDRYYIGAAWLIPAEYTYSGSSISHTTLPSYYSLSHANGNVLGWAKYRSTFECMDEATGAYTKTCSAIVFGKVADILTQMNAVEKAAKD